MVTSPQKEVVLQQLLPNHLGPVDQYSNFESLVELCISGPQVLPMPVDNLYSILEVVQWELEECQWQSLGQWPAVPLQRSLLRRLWRALVLVLDHILLQEWEELAHLQHHQKPKDPCHLGNHQHGLHWQSGRSQRRSVVLQLGTFQLGE